MDDLDSLYQQVILDHSRHPRHQRGEESLEGWSAHQCFNPLCGDSIEVFIDHDDHYIQALKIDAKGCAISVATASMMAERLQGCSLVEARALFDWFQAMVTDLEYEATEDLSPGKLSLLEGVKRFPMRVKCATCAWHAMMAALDGLSSGPVQTEA